MNKTDLLKATVGFVTGFSVSTIVTNVVNNNVPQEKTYEKVAVISGRIVLAMMLNEQVRKYTDSKIDSAVAWTQENLNQEASTRY